MGCDIHPVLEVKGEDGKWHGKVLCWCSRTGSAPDTEGALYIHRNYSLFAMLAGVRNYDGVKPIAEPRGVPDDASEAFVKMNWFRVVPDDEFDENDEWSVRLSDAERWVKGNSSDWRDGKSLVSNPDFHSHSWLTLAEIEAGDRSQKTSGNITAAHDCKRFLKVWLPEAKKAGGEVRLVFCFDN